MEGLIGTPVLLGGFTLAVVLGAMASLTHFCTMGGLSDWVNIGDRSRMGAWLVAVAVSLIAVTLLEAKGAIDLGTTRPPYRSPVLAWPRHLLGGLLFGIGMVLASGCPTKNLVRLGNGSLKALTALLAAAAMAWLMTRAGLYGYLFHGWIQPLTLDLGARGFQGQDLGSLLGGVAGLPVATLRLLSAMLLALGLLLWVWRRSDIRPGHLLGGVMIGLCVAGGWYLTGGPWGQAWQEEALWLAQPPAGVGTQSFTFVNPLAEMLTLTASGGSLRWLTFGVVAVAGVVLGACGHALVAGRFRLEGFRRLDDLLRHLGGGALMGLGGILALGCTIGQGVTGVSTLALGSLLTLGAIILGAAATLRAQYYRMLYDDARLLDVLLSTGADLRLLPARWRRLEWL